MCLEKLKTLSRREWIVRTYYPSKVWGRGRNYDGRKLLHVWCVSCGAGWTEYRKSSPLWKLIKDDPYSAIPEKIVRLYEKDVDNNISI